MPTLEDQKSPLTMKGIVGGITFKISDNLSKNFLHWRKELRQRQNTQEIANDGDDECLYQFA